ncbi:hypothetical protein P4C99_10695 [Pontiellaceae bacterium B1224]|nr:hypothetical protein [Pontiellaceae bacterium B1224]
MAEVKLEDAPQGVRTYYEKGIAALKRDNFDYAMDMFEAMLNVEPRLLQVRRMLRTTAIKKNKTSPLGKMAMAKTVGGFMKASASLKKNPQLAIELSEKLLRIDPLNLKFSKLLCEAAKAAALPEIAIQTLEILKENSAPNLNILEPLAILYREADQFDEEYACFEAITKLKPNDSKVLKQLKDSAARLTMGKAGWQKAESYRDVIRPDAESRLVMNELDQLLARVEAEPNNIDFRQALADCQLKNRQFEAAVQTLEKCLTLGGADPRITKKRWRAKEQHILFKTAAAEDAHDAEAVSNLRKELAELRTEMAAEKVNQHPHDLQMKYEYAKLLFEANDLTGAIQQFQQAQLNPERRIRSLIYLGKAFEKKDQLSIAQEQFEVALSELKVMDETRKEVLYELGLLFEKTGNNQRMDTCFKEIYAVDIGYRDVAVRIES